MRYRIPILLFIIPLLLNSFSVHAKDSQGVPEERKKLALIKPSKQRLYQLCDPEGTLETYKASCLLPPQVSEKMYIYAFNAGIRIPSAKFGHVVNYGAKEGGVGELGQVSYMKGRLYNKENSSLTSPSFLQANVWVSREVLQEDEFQQTLTR
ncbi:MAG: hypothetical protein K0S07_157 [Chlamydiales bacterium]|nr:hypothetical protein [Chlamydiales bacterium]